MRIFLLIGAIVIMSGAVTGCTFNDCAYYGDPDYHVHCVITGPNPRGGYD